MNLFGVKSTAISWVNLSGMPIHDSIYFIDRTSTKPARGWQSVILHRRLRRSFRAESSWKGLRRRIGGAALARADRTDGTGASGAESKSSVGMGGREGGREGEGDAQICWLGLPKVDSDDDDDCRNVLGLDSGAGAQDIPETTQ